MAAQDWLDMLGGKLSGQVGFMSGKLKHKGDEQSERLGMDHRYEPHDHADRLGLTDDDGG